MYRYCLVTKKNYPITFLEKEYLKSLTIFNLVFEVVLLSPLSKILPFDGKYRTFIWNNRIWYVSFLHGILQSITLYQYAYIHSHLRRGGVGGGAAYLVAGGRGTEATVLLWFARLFTPLSDGEGLGWGCFCINIQKWNCAAKGIKLQSESMGFRLRNQGFQDVKPRVLGCETHGFANEKYQLLKVKEKKTKIEAIVIILTNVL